MLILLIKLILSHIVGDFVLQSDRWIEEKEKNKIRSKYLYLHIAIHVILVLIVLQFNIKYIWGILAIGVSHYIIDLVKLNLKNKYNDKILFFTDQLLHILVIFYVAKYYMPHALNYAVIYESKNVLFLTAIVLITSVSSIIMKILISNWNPEKEEETEKQQGSSTSLKKAGSYIGMLERLFIFGFILANQWSGIGFLLAAKSVFRFGDLSKGKDRKLTEYILIGTLLSFGLAIVITKVYIYLFHKLQ